MRNKAESVETAVTLVVVSFDVVHVYKATHAFLVEEPPDVLAELSVLPDVLLVALEVEVVNWVESDQEVEKPDICIGDSVGHQEVATSDHPVQLVEPFEHHLYCLKMSVLVFGEACQVNHIEEVLLVIAVYLVDILPQVLRVDVLFLGGYFVKRRTDDLAYLVLVVVYYLPKGLVHQER